jgi:hypothetical protein
MFDKARQRINVDPDTRIYRVFPFWRALQLFQTGDLALVRPKFWDDPFENLLLQASAKQADGTEVSLEALRAGWYGQCWTRQAESDAMWRIYSHDKMSVRLSTTVGKLFDAVCGPAGQWSSLEFFIGTVEYVPERELVDFFSSLSFADLSHGGQNDRFAQTLLVKRDTFEHEREIRILYCDVQKRQSGDVSFFPVAPLTMVDDIMLDPRLAPAEAATFTQALRSAGFAGPISQSELYRAPKITIKLD